MTKVRDVICPVDFSDFSRRALDHAIAVAKWYGSRLAVLYVHHVPLSAIAPVGGLRATPLEPLALVVGQDPVDDVARVLRSQRRGVLKPAQIAAHTKHRRGADGQVQVRRVLLDDLVQHCCEIEVHNLGLRS